MRSFACLDKGGQNMYTLRQAVVLPSIHFNERSWVMNFYHYWRSSTLATAFVFGLFLCIHQVKAQPSGVTMDVNVVPLDQLTVGDIDFQTGGSNRLFFTVAIRSDSARQAVLRISASVQLPDVAYNDAIRFQTHPFSIPRTFTNLDLGPNTFLRINGEVAYDPQAKDRLQNDALSTGRLPAGTYTFLLKLYDSRGETGGNLLAERSFTFTIRNVSRLDLISPRDGEIVSNTFPLFQWIFDGNRVELSVYERLPQHASKEEATQGTPHLVQVVEGLRTFQYPASAPRPLEPGKTYVWKVRGITAGSGGTGNIINSEIWQFSVQSGQTSMFGGGGGGGGGSQSVTNQLQNIPGLSPQLLAQLSAGNLQLTGVILVNGVPVSPGEIVAILNNLSQNPDKIIDVQIVERP